MVVLLPWWHRLCAFDILHYLSSVAYIECDSNYNKALICKLHFKEVNFISMTCILMKNSKYIVKRETKKIFCEERNNSCKDCTKREVMYVIRVLLYSVTVCS